MNIEDARKTYSSVIKDFWTERNSLFHQKEEAEKKYNETGDTTFSQQAATLELSFQAVDEKYNEYKDFMSKIMELHSSVSNMESSKQQGEAMAEYAEDLAKIMEVARRIANGDIVPPQDEQKLIEYDPELYMSAKNMALMNKMKKKEKYESLWDDEEPSEPKDPNEIADNTEVPYELPEVVSVEEVVSTATAEQS